MTEKPKKKFDFNDRETWSEGDVNLYRMLAVSRVVRAREELANEQYRKALSRKGEQAQTEIPICEQGGTRTKKKFSLRVSK